MNTHPILRQSHHIAQQCLDILFPPRCAGCQRSGHVLCPTCLAAIQPIQPPLCQHCGNALPLNRLCPSCQFRPLKLSGLRAVSLYQEPLRSYIHALKYNGNTRLAEPLGKLMAQTWSKYGTAVDMLLPVPLHSEREQQRGYNQAYLLAEVCAVHSRLPLSNDLLRTRATQAQVGLSASERQHNMAGAFICSCAKGTLNGRRVLLIDDVSTTGATLEACAAALFAAGAREVWGLVLGRPM